MFCLLPFYRLYIPLHRSPKKASTSILPFPGPWWNSCSASHPLFALCVPAVPPGHWGKVFFTLTRFVNTRGRPSRTSARDERSLCPLLGRFDAMLWAGDRHALKRKRCTVVQGCFRVSYNFSCLGVGVCVGSCRISLFCNFGSGVSIFDGACLGGEVCSQGGSPGHGWAARANSARQEAHPVPAGGPIPQEHNPCPSGAASLTVPKWNQVFNTCKNHLG